MPNIGNSLDLPGVGSIEVLDLPMLRGRNIAMIACVDWLVVSKAPLALVTATGAGWGTLTTHGGGARAYTHDNPVGIAPAQLAKLDLTEIAAIEKLRMEKALAAGLDPRDEMCDLLVEVRHLGCAAYGFHLGSVPPDEQYRILLEDQRSALPLFLDPGINPLARVRLAQVVFDHKSGRWLPGPSH